MNAQRLFRNLSLLNKAAKALRWLDIIKIAVLAITVLFCGFEIIREYATAKNGG